MVDEHRKALLRNPDSGRQWGIELEGKRTISRSGVAGREPKWSVREFDVNWKAENYYEQRLAQMTDKGFCPLEDLPLYAPHELVDPVDSRLLKKVIEAPDNVGACAIYGDWLHKQGSPRGKLVALGLAAAADQAKQTRQRLADLVEEHHERWLGPIAFWGESCSVEFRYGFPERMWLGLDPDLAADVFADWRLRCADLWDVVLQVPYIETVRELTVGCLHPDEPTRDYAPLIQAMGDTDRLPNLRVLRLGEITEPGAGPDPRDEATIDISPLCSGYRGLRQVLLAAAVVDSASPLRLPELGTLVLRSEWAEGFMDKLGKARCPKLHTLSIQASDLELRQLKKLMSGKLFPALRWLELDCPDQGDALAEALEGAAVMEQLEGLNLHGCDEGVADALCDAWPAVQVIA